MGLSAEEKTGVLHALEAQNDGVPWKCECTACEAVRRDNSPDLIEVYMAFEKLEILQKRHDDFVALRSKLGV